MVVSKHIIRICHEFSFYALFLNSFSLLTAFINWLSRHTSCIVVVCLLCPHYEQNSLTKLSTQNPKLYMLVEMLSIVFYTYIFS